MLADCERQAEAMLRRSGLLPTPSRVRCLAAAMKASGPVARGGFLAAFSDPPDRVTLYRTLKTLESRGLLRRSESAAGPAWCAEDPSGGSAHMHFSCESCGRTECVKTGGAVARAVGGVFGAAGVKSIEASGLCRRCSKRRR